MTLYKIISPHPLSLQIFVGLREGRTYGLYSKKVTYQSGNLVIILSISKD